MTDQRGEPSELSTTVAVSVDSECGKQFRLSQVNFGVD